MGGSGDFLNAKDSVFANKVAKVAKVAKDKVAKDRVAKDKVAKDRVAKDKVAKDKQGQGGQGQGGQGQGGQGQPQGNFLLQWAGPKSPTLSRIQLSFCPLCTSFVRHKPMGPNIALETPTSQSPGPFNRQDHEEAADSLELNIVSTMKHIYTMRTYRVIHKMPSSKIKILSKSFWLFKFTHVLKF